MAGLTTNLLKKRITVAGSDGTTVTVDSQGNAYAPGTEPKETPTLTPQPADAPQPSSQPPTLATPPSVQGYADFANMPNTAGVPKAPYEAAAQGRMGGTEREDGALSGGPAPSQKTRSARPHPMNPSSTPGFQGPSASIPTPSKLAGNAQSAYEQTTSYAHDMLMQMAQDPYKSLQYRSAVNQLVLASQKALKKSSRELAMAMGQEGHTGDSTFLASALTSLAAQHDDALLSKRADLMAQADAQKTDAVKTMLASRPDLAPLLQRETAQQEMVQRGAQFTQDLGYREKSLGLDTGLRSRAMDIQETGQNRSQTLDEAKFGEAVRQFDQTYQVDQAAADDMWREMGRPDLAGHPMSASLFQQYYGNAPQARSLNIQHAAEVLRQMKMDSTNVIDAVVQDNPSLGPVLNGMRGMPVGMFMQMLPAIGQAMGIPEEQLYRREQIRALAQQTQQSGDLHPYAVRTAAAGASSAEAEAAYAPYAAYGRANQAMGTGQVALAEGAGAQTRVGLQNQGLALDNRGKGMGIEALAMNNYVARQTMGAKVRTEFAGAAGAELDNQVKALDLDIATLTKDAKVAATNAAGILSAASDRAKLPHVQEILNLTLREANAGINKTEAETDYEHAETRRAMSELVRSQNVLRPEEVTAAGATIVNAVTVKIKIAQSLAKQYLRTPDMEGYNKNALDALVKKKQAVDLGNDTYWVGTQDTYNSFQTYQSEAEASAASLQSMGTQLITGQSAYADAVRAVSEFETKRGKPLTPDEYAQLLQYTLAKKTGGGK